MHTKKLNLKGVVCALLACALVVMPVAPAKAATARATTMKLEKTEGTVTLKTQNGSARKITKGMRLLNGNTLKTEKYSYAYVSLDSSKAVKLDQSSAATLRQNGKELELLVKSGKLFFNVSQKLGAKESMNVRTSTMVTGIRGTCGVVEYVDQNKSKLYLIEGRVTLGSGENATVVEGGQTATVILQPKEETGGSQQPEKPGNPGEGDQTDGTGKEMEQKVLVETLTEKTIPAVALQEIVNNPVLQEKIEQTTELKIEKIEEAFEQFQKEEAERIEQEKAEQEKEEGKEEQKEEQTTDNTTTGGGSSYPSTPSTPAPVESTLAGTISAAAINAALATYSTVTVAASGTDAAGGNVETDVTLEDSVTVPKGKVLIMETGKITGSAKLSCGDGTIIDRGNVSGIADQSLLSITGDATVYAKEFNPQVAGYVNELAQKASSVSVNFNQNAVVTSNITLQPASGSQQMIQLNMNENTLEIQSGTLTLASDVSISGSTSNALVLLSGGNLVLQGISTNANTMIHNTGAGATIKRTAGTVTWNDTGLAVANLNGAQLAIDGASVSGEMVTIPEWVIVKTGYVPAWQNNTITLQSVPSEFTSGTVSAADLNRALYVYQTVTVGADAKANLSSNDQVTVPAGKTLNILSKVTQVGTNQYSGGFYLGKETSFILGDGADLNINGNGFFGGNGIITVGAGAKIEVNTNCTLQADEIKLTNNSSIINNGLIDGGKITSEGNAAVTNHTLIKLTGAYTSSGSKDTYTDTDNSALITGGQSTALSDDALLAYNSGQSRYCYAAKLNTIVASYMNNDTWTFSKDAIVASTVTLTDFTAELNTNKLDVRGNLTFTGTLNITGMGTQTIYLNGGTVILNGTSTTSANMIQNTNAQNGYAIDWTSGSLEWNDSSMNIIATASINQGVSYTISGSSFSDGDSVTVVTLPNWVTGSVVAKVVFDHINGNLSVPQ